MWDFVLPDGNPIFAEQCAFWSYDYRAKEQLYSYHVVNLATGEWISTGY